MKRVIQAFKASHQWANSPPGLGGFVRGACHLSEMFEGSEIELRIDVSQTGFASLIKQDPLFFCIGEEGRIASAEEYFVDHAALHRRLVAFLHSDETELFICTNLGAWNRTVLPEHTRGFIQKFYSFSHDIECMTALALPCTDYEVLSVRCGDSFYSNLTGNVPSVVKSLICSLIEQQIMPRKQHPMVLTSDCHALKVELAQRYGFLTLPHRSQHGAFGNSLPVAMDLCMLKNSRFNFHINAWASWWSGFSHYTSVIFNIASMNFRAPHFVKEEITAKGELLTY